MLDVSKMVDAVIAVVDKAVRPLADRVKALEARAPERGEKGDSGEKGDKGERGEKGEPGEAGAKGEPGEAGKQGEAGPRGDPGSPGEKGEPGLKGDPGRDGRDGATGLNGKDGAAGLNGKDGAPGRDGIDGKDGLGFDDIDVEHDGERGFKFVFIRGDQRKEFGTFKVPAMIDRGVWKDGPYEKGDVVTWGGSAWTAQKDTTTKPDTKDSDWRLTVKRGKDGANGKDGKPGERGLEGPRGRDLTQITADGMKF